MSTAGSYTTDRAAIVNLGIVREVLGTSECRELALAFDGDAWIYRYSMPDRGWQLSIATLGEPDSGTYSLGGFRIAPEERTKIEDYNNDREALQLAIGMEEKVSRSRLVGVAGPLGKGLLKNIVGGKCVLCPTGDARIGKPFDYELLDFAAASLADFEATTRISITTGQDLGHGVMSDEQTTSLEYLHEHFEGSITADTARPTGEGNYFVLKGILDALGIELKDARIGFVGCGNVGAHVLRRVHEKGATIFAIELRQEEREQLRDQLCIDIRDASEKNTMLAMNLDAVVVNAAGGSVDNEAVTIMCDNDHLKIVCGCENLAFPNPANMRRLMDHRIIYAPTEFCGMMGYLTAFEQYLSQKTGKPFNMNDMFTACKPLEKAGYRVAHYILDNDYRCLFDDAINAIYESKPKE